MKNGTVLLRNCSNGMFFSMELQRRFGLSGLYYCSNEMFLSMELQRRFDAFGSHYCNNEMFLSMELLSLKGIAEIVFTIVHSGWYSTLGIREWVQHRQRLIRQR